MALWLVRLSLDQAVQIRALPGDRICVLFLDKTLNPGVLNIIIPRARMGSESIGHEAEG